MLKQIAQKFLLNRWYLKLPAISIFIYSILRAKNCSLTWDEANTYFEFVRTPHWITQQFNFMSANNHLLNTWLMKIFISLFGSSELVLRLPNVLAGGIFLVVVIKLLTKIFSDWKIQLIGFILLACNPYLIDFFSIARGYGISIAMIWCSIYFVFKFIATKYEIRNALLSLFFLLLATLANLTCLNILLATLFLLSALLFFDGEKKNKMWKIFSLFPLPLIFIALLLPYIFKLQNAGALFLGKETTSPIALVASLADGSAYQTTCCSWLSPLLVRIFYLIPLLALIEIVRRKKFIRTSPASLALLFFTVLLILLLIIPILQHYFLGTNFISGRAALYFLPLFFLLLLLIVQRSHRIVFFLTSFFSLALLANFIFSLNTSSYFDYREQADVKAMMQLLREKKITAPKKYYANVLCSNLPYEAQINYYLMRYGMNAFGHVARNEQVEECGYYYLNDSEMNRIQKPKDILAHFPFTNTSLFKVRSPEKFNYLNEVWQDFEHEDAFLELRTDTIFIGEKGTFAGGTHPYSIGVAISVPDSVKGNLVASLNCRLNYFSRNTSALLVFSFEDAAGKIKSWEGMHISELAIPPHEWSITGWTRPVPADTKKVRVYIWNTDKTEVLMDNVALRLLSVPL